MSGAIKPKSRLGRGLSSLISVSDLPVEAEAVPAVETPAATPVPLPVTVSGSPQELPVSAILPNPHQPRKQFDEASLLALAASIRTTGLIQPIVVRRASAAGQ